MDDEAMMKLDDALNAVFKTQLQAKKDKNKKKGDDLYSGVCAVLLHRKDVYPRLVVENCCVFIESSLK